MCVHCCRLIITCILLLYNFGDQYYVNKSLIKINVGHNTFSLVILYYNYIYYILFLM